MSDTGFYPFVAGETLSAVALNAAIAMGQSNQWRSGAGAPSNAVGKDGDMYLNTTTGDIYQRVSGIYVLQANIKGPAGAPGPTTPGPPGPAGPAGSSGVSSIATTGGISGGPITTSGTLQVQWNGPLVNALGSNLTAVGGTLQVTSVTASQVPALSALTGAVTYTQLPAEVQQVPISFPFASKPGVSAVINVPMSMSLVVPASLAGATAYATTKATASSVFTVNRITGGTTITAIGTATITNVSNTSVTLAGTGATLAVGDVLQVVSPSVADATLADVSLTILTSRV